MTMTAAATLQTQLDALRNARASGVRVVEYQAANGTRERVEYRSDAELAAAIADIERRLAALARPSVKTTYINSLKGA